MSNANDDYLWDRSGEPDPDVARLEALLSALGHDRAATFASRSPDASQVSASPRAPLVAGLLAAAAAVLLIVSGVWWLSRSEAETVRIAVTALEGTPRIDHRAVGATARLAHSHWLETDLASRAQVQMDGIGLIEIEPGSRLRLLSVAAGAYRFRLERGAVQAFITAPAGKFIVETPLSVAVDLGCAYALDVDDGGASELRVTAGLVALTSGGSEALVPAGFTCAAVSGASVCTPSRVDSGATFRDAIREFDAPGNRADRRDAVLERVLSEARADDALTLWHLLRRSVDVSSRVRIYNRLAEIAPPPPAARRDAVLAGDRTALDAWFDSFGFGALALWRTIAIEIDANK